MASLTFTLSLAQIPRLLTLRSVHPGAASQRFWWVTTPEGTTQCGPVGRTPVRVLQLVSEVMETRHPQGWVCCASRPTPPLPRWHVHSSRWLAWCVNTSLRGRVLGRRALKLVHALSKRWAQQNQEWLVEGPLPLREVVALSPYGQS